MTKINKGPGFSPRIGQTGQAEQAPAAQKAQVEAKKPAGPADKMDQTAGTATGAPTAAQGQALPRSGWANQATLNQNVAQARATLDAEVQKSGEVNFRVPQPDTPAVSLPVDPNIFLPMYGMPMPPEFAARPSDVQLREVFDKVMQDSKITDVEAKQLVEAALDGGVMTARERQDLERILHNLTFELTGQAHQIINDQLMSSPDGLNLQTGAIRDALRGMMGDFQIDANEASGLVQAALDEQNGLGSLSDAQKNDLSTIVSSLRLTSTAKALLMAAIKDEPNIHPPEPPIAPMYGVAVPSLSRQLKDKGLREAFEGMLQDFRIDKADAEALIKAANDGGRLSKTEKEDLQLILNDVAQFIDADAKAKLETYIGLNIIDPIDILPMYGMPNPIDVGPGPAPTPGPSPIDIMPMYGMPNPIDVGPIDGGPVVRPMYGMPIGAPLTGVNPAGGDS